MSALDDLVDSVFSAPSTRTCWRERISGKALELVELVEARDPDPPRAKLCRALAKAGESIRPSSISEHYTGVCRCQAQKS